MNDYFAARVFLGFWHESRRAWPILGFKILASERLEGEDETFRYPLESRKSRCGFSSRGGAASDYPSFRYFYRHGTLQQLHSKNQVVRTFESQ